MEEYIGRGVFKESKEVRGKGILPTGRSCGFKDRLIVVW
jgi:hypothetical protein